MLLAMLSLTSCATSGPSPNSYCENAFPIPLDREDKLTPPTLRLFIKHNEKGAALCGWKAPGK